MKNTTGDKFSAGEQGLGYMYQSRLALLKLFELPEDASVLIEADDDLDFSNQDGSKTLASLKHKAAGGRLTDLSTDFWKSVRIWLDRYNRDGRTQSNLQFFLLTTEDVATASLPSYFLNGVVLGEGLSLRERAKAVLEQTTSKIIVPIKDEFNQLNDEEQDDFLSRIVIFHGSPRISDIPDKIKSTHLRTVRRESRDAVFERLEGWWTDRVIKLLTREKTDPISGNEVSDRLNIITDEYKTDNLPITFREEMPTYEVDADKDTRLFVKQLREIGAAPNRIRNAILDYYRAFEQRSEWARENLLLSNEMESYESRLVDEWERYRDLVSEELSAQATDDALKSVGRRIYNWVDSESGKIESLRIRERVTEPYVLRGGYHILANEVSPRVYWHPHFLNRIGCVLGVTK